jgi:hypothetical protein
LGINGLVANMEGEWVITDSQEDCIQETHPDSTLPACIYAGEDRTCFDETR